MKLAFSSQVPSDSTLNVGPFMSFFSARFIRSFAGSDPLFNIRTHGVKLENFLYINSKLKIKK